MIPYISVGLVSFCLLDAFLWSVQLIRAPDIIWIILLTVFFMYSPRQQLLTHIQWLRWCAHNKPNIFFPCAIAAMGPVFLFVVTPLRRKFIYPDAAPLPMGGYPIPNRPRKPITGFDDEEEVQVATKQWSWNLLFLIFWLFIANQHIFIYYILMSFTL